MSLRAGLRTEHSSPSRAALAVMGSPRDYGANEKTITW
jgi:hypothetical protein